MSEVHTPSEISENIIVDSDARPEAESDTNADAASQEHSEQIKSPKQEVSEALGKALDLITKNKRDGAFADSQIEEVDNALRYREIPKEVNHESSKVLSSLLGVLQSMRGEESSDLSEILRKYIKVRVDSGELILLDDWEQKIKELPSEQQEVLKSQGLYAFSFPQVEVSTQSEDEAQPNDLTEQIISDQITALSLKIEMGNLSEEDMISHKKAFVKLQAAQRAKGEWGILLRANAIQQAENVGIEINEADKESIINKFTETREQFEELMEENGISQEDVEELLENIQKGNLEGLENHPIVQQIEGLTERILGSEIDTDTVNMILESSDIPADVKEKMLLNKNSVSLALLLALYGIILVVGGVENLT